MKLDYMKMLRAAVVIAVVFTVAIVTLGTMAIPVVMSLVYSWYWMFLYAGYLLVAFFVALYLNTTTGRAQK